jgi:hypothetical protein
MSERRHLVKNSSGRSRGCLAISLRIPSYTRERSTHAFAFMGQKNGVLECDKVSLMISLRRVGWLQCLVRRGSADSIDMLRPKER